MIKITKKGLIPAAILAGSLFVGGQSMAAGDAYKTGKTQTDEQMQQTHTQESSGHSQFGHSQTQGMHQSHQVSKLMDKEVQGQNENKIGKVSDLIVNEQGQIEYLIISSGGIVGIGENFIPIPWDKVQQTGQEDALVVNIDENQLKNAPKFSENALDQPEWQNEVRGYYGAGQQGSQEDIQFDQDRLGTQGGRSYFDQDPNEPTELDMDKGDKNPTQ